LSREISAESSHASPSPSPSADDPRRAIATTLDSGLPFQEAEARDKGSTSKPTTFADVATADPSAHLSLPPSTHVFDQEIDNTSCARPDPLSGMGRGVGDMEALQDLWENTDDNARETGTSDDPTRRDVVGCNSKARTTRPIPPRTNPLVGKVNSQLANLSTSRSGLLQSGGFATLSSGALDEVFDHVASTRAQPQVIIPPRGESLRVKASPVGMDDSDKLVSCTTTRRRLLAQNATMEAAFPTTGRKRARMDELDTVPPVTPRRHPRDEADLGVTSEWSPGADNVVIPQLPDQDPRNRPIPGRRTQDHVRKHKFNPAPERIPSGIHHGPDTFHTAGAPEEPISFLKPLGTPVLRSTDDMQPYRSGRFTSISLQPITLSDTAFLTGVIETRTELEDFVRSPSVWASNHGLSYESLVNVTVKPLTAYCWLVTAAVRRGGTAGGNIDHWVSTNRSPASQDLDMDSTYCPSEVQEEVRGTKRGCWTSEEDSNLRKWRQVGKSWPWIVDQFPQRTEAAIKSRWFVVLARQAHKSDCR
jgi:hypothetical protein